jgi:uncharacterized membrane protein
MRGAATSLGCAANSMPWHLAGNRTLPRPPSGGRAEVQRLTLGWGAMVAVSAGGALLATAAASTALRGSALARVVPPPMISFSACLALSNMGAIPASAVAYNMATSRALPISVGLALLSSAQPAARVGRALVPAVQAFGLFSAATTVGAIVAFRVIVSSGMLPIPQAACAAGCLCATYVGGTANLLAVAAATDARSHTALLPSLLAADAALMGCHFALLAWAARFRPAQRLLAQDVVTAQGDGAEVPTARVKQQAGDAAPANRLRRWGVPSAGVAIAAAAGIGAGWLETSRTLPSGSALAIICLVCASSAVAASRHAPTVASLRTLALPAELLSCLFLGSLGAGTELRALAVAGPAAALMCAIVLSVHSLLGVGGALLANRLCGARITLPALLTASNAAVGGSSTATAMALAFGWGEMVAPAAACGSIGYALATALGVGLCGALSR